MPTSIKNFINNYITKKRLVATRYKCSCPFHLDMKWAANGNFKTELAFHFQRGFFVTECISEMKT